VAAPAVALVAGFASYKAQSQPLNPVASSLASYHQRVLPPGGIVADGSGTAMIAQPSSSPKASAKPAKAAQSVTAKAPTPAPSTQSGSSGNSAASLQASVQKDIASGNDLLAIGQYLVENGYSAAAAAGVASCVDGESGGNPESVGSGGGGLIGWTPLSSAAPNPNVITGNVAQDMMTQLADLLYYNSTEIGQSLVVELNSNTDPVAAADFYSQNFEKPAVTDSDVVPAVAEQVFSELGG
jgi:Phage tail lysozyme